MRPPTPALPVTDEQRSVLEKLIRWHTAPHRDVQGARVLVMACGRFASTRIAAEMGVAPMTVRAWRDRCGEDCLKDFSAMRGSGPTVVDPGRDGRGGRPVDALRDAAR